MFLSDWHVVDREARLRSRAYVLLGASSVSHTDPSRFQFWDMVVRLRCLLPERVRAFAKAHPWLDDFDVLAASGMVGGTFFYR